MKKLFTITLLFLLACGVEPTGTMVESAQAATHLHSEAEYVNHYCKGEVELRNEDNTRTDCYTPMYSQEYDFAVKWYECVSQALYYAMLHNNLAKCVLIVEDVTKEQKYVDRAMKTIIKYNIPIALETVGKY